MQVISYKNGGLAGNWYALYAAILNPELSSKQALGCFDIRQIESNINSTKVYKLNPIDLNEARKLYEKGMTIQQVAAHFRVEPKRAKNAILEAGGTVRKQGGYRRGKKKDRTTISNQ